MTVRDTTPRQTRSADGYARAQHHSRRVAFFKLALPAVAGVILLVAIAYALIVRSLTSVDGDVDVAGAAIDGGNLVMSNPKVTGTTSGNRAYRIEALRATQAIDGSSGVRLEDISAAFDLSAGISGNLHAATGLLTDDNKRLALSGQSVFTTSDGLVARFDQADIDMENGTLTTSTPVRIEQPGTIVEAGSMRVEDNGARIVFESDVMIVIDMSRVSAPNRDTLPSNEESRSANEE